jgi:putative ABC transport system substrate-binding protein
MAYGPAQHDNPRNMATMVDKIPQGTRPSEVPVEQPTRYELIVNKATARVFSASPFQTLY